MEQIYVQEMQEKIASLEQQGVLQGRRIFIFGHCHATEQLADLLLMHGYQVQGILDNNQVKYGQAYRGIPIVPPERILSAANATACIATRFYEAMRMQLRKLGFCGQVFKIIDYNTYADYSLTPATLTAKKARVQAGAQIVQGLREKYGNIFRVFCPFAALGDIYIMMSYLPSFLRQRGLAQCLIVVPGGVLKKVIALFGDFLVEVLPQKELDAAIQAELATGDADFFIAHQDRPYIVNLHQALYVKLIPLKTIYRAGVFGLSADTAAAVPTHWVDYQDARLRQGRSVILSPYAKSVTALAGKLWEKIAKAYLQQGYAVFTNVSDMEQPIAGTDPISPAIAELKSAAEQAGTFIGIRSGLCDLLVTARAKKVALYPDYNYSDTQWKAIDMYFLPEFSANLVVDEDTLGFDELVSRILSV